ncbi:MAG TPA: hypothetical protein VFG83_15000 [Kofleriaceae bacterium]|nr:hypothetical protein [Kofleriaceae bacterium]
MSPKTETTNLWSLAWRLQETLEDQGLDDDVIDAAVTRGLTELIAGDRPAHRRPLGLAWWLKPATAKA